MPATKNKARLSRIVLIAGFTASCSAKLSTRIESHEQSSAQCPEGCDPQPKDTPAPTPPVKSVNGNNGENKAGNNKDDSTKKDDGGANSDPNGNTPPAVETRKANVAFSLVPYLGPNIIPGAKISIAGTASADDESGDEVKVSISIQKVGGLCLNNTGSAFDQTCPHWNEALGTSNWTYEFDKTALGANSASYQVTARSEILPLSIGASKLETHQFKWDTEKPQLTSFSLNGGAATASKPMGTGAFQATDSDSPITAYCVRSVRSSTAPLPSDSCFVEVNQGSIKIDPAPTLNAADVPVRIGYIAATYHTYIWVKDAAGNVSEIGNSGNGASGIDHSSIQLQPTSAPTILDVLATNSLTPASPPTGTDLTFSTGSTVHIKWNVSDDKVLPGTPISVFYTTDDLAYHPVASNLINGSNNGCTVDEIGTSADDDSTGCYTWTSGSPTSSYFRIRVSAIDSDGFESASSSVPLNAPNFSVVAGNSDPGTGASASTAMFLNHVDNRTSFGGADAGSFVVTDEGVLYFRDIYRGILTVHPNDGLQKLFIPTTGASSGDGGPASTATLKAPARLALDFDQNLLILDFDRIRKVDFSKNPATITTIIGGGASSIDGINPLDAKLDSAGASFSQYQGNRLLQPLPNGDIWFLSNLYMTHATKLLIYKKETGKVSYLSASGTGNGGYPDDNIGSLKKEEFGIGFNPSTSEVVNVIAQVAHPVVGNTAHPFSNLNSHTGVAEGPHPPYWQNSNASWYIYGGSFVPTMTGELYIFSSFQEGVLKKYDRNNNTWVTVLGGINGVATCEDGTAALLCPIAAQAFFIGTGGKIYFMELGRLRTIDDEGNVQSIFGQSFASGDNTQATNARLGKVKGLQVANNGDIVIYDSVSMRLREVTHSSGIIRTVAGNGSMSGPVPNTTTLAAGQAIYDVQTYSPIAIDRVTGDLYFPMNTNVFRLTKATGIWQHFLYAGGAATYYESSDGLSNVRVTYQPTFLGYTGTELGMYVYRWNGTAFVDRMYKTYNSSTRIQSHLAGVSGVTTSNCDPTANIDTANCATLTAYPSAWDSIGNRWLISRNQTIVSMVPGGKVTVLATLPREAMNFAYYGSSAPARSWAFYCSDGRMYRYSLLTAVEDELNSGIPGFNCTGQQIDYDAVRSRLITPFIQSQYGVQAVGAFHVPDAP